MRETEPCNAPCGRCDDDGNILVTRDHHDGEGPRAEHEPCDVCHGDRVGNQWWLPRPPRIAAVLVDDESHWHRPFVSEDMDDAPRRSAEEVRDLPDVPDWWRLDGTITISSAQFAAGDMVEVDGVVHTITAVDGDNITVQFWR